jgi:hypothetical protein
MKTHSLLHPNKLKHCGEISVINMEPKRKTGSSNHRHHLPPFASATRILLKPLHVEIIAF